MVATEEELINSVASVTEAVPAAPAQVIDPVKTPLWAIDGRFLNPDADVSEEPTYITMGERKALPLQGIISFSAKPKQGKSTAIRALLMSIITGMRFDSVTPVSHKPRLCVVFDTEMSVTTLQVRTNSMRKVLGEDANRYQVVPLLGVPKHQRIDVIEDITTTYNPDIVVIDQIAMLVDDYNSSQESNTIRDRLLMLSAQRSVWCVIHQNKSADSNQMKGHLGSLLNEAATENYSVRHINGVYEVKPVNSRISYVDEQTKGFTFAMDEQGNITSATDIVLRNKEKDCEQQVKDLIPIFGSDEVLQRGVIVDRITEQEHIETRAAETRVTNAIKVNALVKVGENHRAPYRLKK